MDKNEQTTELTPELNWDILKEIGVNERHFNNLEIEYRKLASVWLLASFGGIGFLLKENLKMVIPLEVAMIGIGMAGSIGNILIWIVDLLVYHRLLDACFDERKRFEELHPEMPQTRQHMMNYQKGGHVTTSLRWFYVLLVAAPVVFSAPFFIIWCFCGHGILLGILATSIIMLYIITMSIIILNKTSLNKIK